MINHVDRTREVVSKLVDWYSYSTGHEIIPKDFKITRMSESGKLAFRKWSVGDAARFSEWLIPTTSLSRVIFDPDPIDIGKESYYIEVKGYGLDGKFLNLLMHSDGDPLFGTFYKNAKKEFRILDKAKQAGLLVHHPLLLGKFDREVVIESGLRNYAFLLDDRFDAENREMIHLDLSASYERGLDSLKGRLNHYAEGNMLAAEAKRQGFVPVLEQPFDLGVVVRGSLSPIRMGDPSENYPVTDMNVAIARQVGATFIGLLELGYLHLCPGTGNWSLAGELADMADCYDLKKDKNLNKLIAMREASFGNFWQDLIGPRHTSEALHPFFIEGMYGRAMRLEDAAARLE